MSLSRLQDYDNDPVICHPRFEESRRTGDFPGVFVVMPFTKKLRAIYDDHIKTTVERAGFTCARGDDLFGSESIIREIWTIICNAQVIIADCTGRNPNVFYEIGIAHTVGVPVILVTQSVDDVPFDLRNERVIVYDHTPAGLASLEHAIQQALEFERSGVQSAARARARGAQTCDVLTRLRRPERAERRHGRCRRRWSRCRS